MLAGISFEQWDAEGVTLVGTFDSEEAALGVVRRSLASFGEPSIRTLNLAQEDASDAGPRIVASGPNLAKLAPQGG